MTLAVVTGLIGEARIARAPGVAAVVGAGRSNQLAADLETAIASGARRLLSFGVAGALAPHLLPGDLIVGRALIDGARRTPCDAGWSAAMTERLNRAAPSLRTFLADVAGVDTPIADPLAKAALHAATGAAAVDMESAIVARAAERHRLPFAILRAIADPAHRALPPAALIAMRADGGVDLAAVLGALGREPRQSPALVRLALDSRRAFAALARARALLGADFASVDLGEL